MGKKRMKRTTKKKFNIFFKIVATFSAIVAIVFSVALFILNMVPLKYLTIIYFILFVLYLMLLFLVFKSKIKIVVKAFCIIIFIIFDIIFGIGIKYISETINFVDVIDNKMNQKEKYYVMTLSNYDKVDDLENKIIGVYSTLNSKNASEKLMEKIKFTLVEFSDVLEMFDDLEENEIDAILVNGSIKNLIDTEYNDLGIKLSEVYNLSISIDHVEDIVKVVDVTKKPFNIYVAGGDAYGDIGNVTNTDVNMVVSVDPVNKKLLLTSIPRDYYVNLPGQGTNAYDKLTHAGYYGIEESVQAVEKLLDIDINYYVKINFSTIEGVIDAIGGVDVYSDYSFCANGLPNLCYQKGNMHMDGYHALMFARERYAFKDGDVQRVKNQQKVFESIINKATSSTIIITGFSEILDSVSNNFSTNLDSKSISRLAKMQLNNMSSWSVDSQNLVGSDFSSSNTYTFPGTELYVMKQDENSVNSVSDEIKKFLKDN